MLKKNLQVSISEQGPGSAGDFVSFATADSDEDKLVVSAPSNKFMLGITELELMLAEVKKFHQEKRSVAEPKICVESTSKIDASGYNVTPKMVTNALIGSGESLNSSAETFKYVQPEYVKE